MDCNHYEFSEKPFDVTPDPRFLYLTSDHRETLASLIYGIQERRGFITIVGEVGTGKTTLLNATLDRVEGKTKVAFIFNTDVTFDEMLSMALYEWGLITSRQSLSRVNAIQRLNNFAIEQLAEGGNVVLIVDEAQNLDNSVMENLRLLSNLETRRHKLVQIVLSGQPELDTKLGQHELRQLAERISLKRYILPLNKKDTYAYLQHRLAISKSKDLSLFDRKAQELIWEYSGGIPRKINILCDNAFLIGYGLKQKKIQAAVIQEAAQDLKWSLFSTTNESLDFSPSKTDGILVETKPLRGPLTVATTIVLVGSLIFVGSFFSNKKGFQFAKLANFISHKKATALEIIQPKPKKQQTHSTFFEIPTQPIELKIVTENVAVEAAESKIHADNEQLSDRPVPFKEDERMQPVVVKQGETLSGIIFQTYGVYDDAKLDKVLRKNPNIINPHRIFAGQVIELPVGKEPITIN
jgi:general secretion pathway protein A